MKEFKSDDEYCLSDLSDADYLLNLKERLRSIPVMYGIDGHDIDRVHELSTKCVLKHENGNPMYSACGMLLDQNGNRSIFDDIDF